MDAHSSTLQTQWHPRLLAGLLRSTPLTLVFGDADAGKSALLKSGLLPLLRRRTSDLEASLGMQLGAVQRMPPSRSKPARATDGGASGQYEAEIVIVVDDWSAAPLTQVIERLKQALPSSLAATLAGVSSLAAALGIVRDAMHARLLFVFDCFEDCLFDLARDRPGSASFSEDFIAVVNDTALNAHFLLAVRDDAEPLLHRFEGRIDGFGERSLRLPGRRERTGPPEPPDAAAPDATSPTETPAAAAERREDSAEIDASLAKLIAGWVAVPTGESATIAVKASVRPAARVSAGVAPQVAADRAWPGGLAAPVLSAPAADAPAPNAPLADETLQSGVDIDLGEDHAEADELPAIASRRHARTREWVWPLASVATLTVLTVVAYLLWPMTAPQSLRSAVIAASPSPAVAEKPAALPAEPRAIARFPAELAALLETGAERNAAVRPATGWAEALAFEPGAARLVVARYDALQAQRDKRGAKALNIVVPLGVEALVYVTRRDAPIAFIHEMADQRIDAGPADGERALTAATVHARLFDTPWRATADTTLSAEKALQRLVAPDGAGVALVSARDLDDFMLANPAAERLLKPLRLDMKQPSSRDALHTYLPLTLKASAHPRWLQEDQQMLGVMSFVVAPADPGPADEAQVQRFAQALCRDLRQLQRSGAAEWRQVAPLEQVPALWPYSQPAAQALAACASPTSPLSQGSPTLKGGRS